MIKLDNIEATYTTVRGKVKAVEGVSLEIPDGIIMGIAGESGCGKTTLMKVIYGDTGFPLALSQGSVDYGFENDQGERVTSKNIQKEWFRHISYIPQSSMSSLNPVVRIRDQFTDFPATSKKKRETLELVREYVQKLGLPPESIDSYPHQLSGGMQQRIMVALATFLQPRIILADEPTTALDVVVQKDILILLMRLQRMMKNNIIFVSHDMGVHFQITHKMMIMYAAKTVEFANTEDIFNDPLHPYSLMLTSSLPTIGDDRARKGLPGRPPSLWDPPKGCRFAKRCPLAIVLCHESEPQLLEHRPGRFSACHRVDAMPDLIDKMRHGPKLSEFVKDADKLIAEVESALKADETGGTAVQEELE
ncbi:MAG: ABC transporter ATP-binding protein [Ardenticatenaceae bacterium]|nr:ABC transporter ATP-binding protein [Ardenticatenaceae bacterium]MCB9445882.1 ABC transporter ATP-binding protein [Ardenticatenaceae bacterium]